MKVDSALVRHVARVSRLELSDLELKRFTPELKEILEMFREIEEVDTEGIEICMQPVEVKDACREDQPSLPLSKKEALANSPNTMDGYFKGPKAI